MTDFTKAKIGFALALLGVLFAIHPIIRDLGNIGFMFFGLLLEIRIFYYTVALFLSITVYAYAIEFISDRPVTIAQRVGNIVYAIALFVPASYSLLWITSWLAKFAVFVSKSPMAGAITSSLFGVLSGALSALLFNSFRRKLNSKDRKNRVVQLSLDTGLHINRATEMFKASYYDLSVFEAFRAIETTLQIAVMSKQTWVRGEGFQNLLDVAIKANVIPQEIGETIEEIRILRNRAIHLGATASSTKHVLEQTRKILGAITRKVEIEKESE